MYEDSRICTRIVVSASSICVHNVGYEIRMGYEIFEVLYENFVLMRELSVRLWQTCACAPVRPC